MKPNTDERLERAIEKLDELIPLVREAGLAQSELFLEMAKLQLQLDLNGITDDEFGAFCEALESRKFASAGCERPAASFPRARRNGEMRIMGRGRHGTQDLRQRGAGR
jgi:hypothetical protein